MKVGLLWPECDQTPSEVASVHVPDRWDTGAPADNMQQRPNCDGLMTEAVAVAGGDIDPVALHVDWLAAVVVVAAVDVQ